MVWHMMACWECLIMVVAYDGMCVKGNDHC